MSTAIATQNGNLAVQQADFTAQQIKMIQASIMPGANELEFDLFINLCKAKRLDPLTKQIYAVKVGGKWQHFASIDGLRVIAERTGNYGGQTEPYWCGPDGEWRDVWLGDKPPSAAKVGVWKRGYEHPTWGVATFKSYGTGKGNNWASMPDVMLAKCAEALALRKAFPDDLSALYVSDEFPEEYSASQPSRPVQAQQSRPAPTPVHAEVVDAETGEITMTAKEMGEEIKKLREVIGWSADDVRNEARRLDLDLRTKDGLLGMIATLDGHVTRFMAEDDDEEDYEGIEAAQGTLIDAETKPIDRWANN